MRARSLAFASALAVLAGSIAHAQLSQQEQLNATLQNLETSKKNEAAIQEKLHQTQAELEAMAERSTGLAERLQISERRVSAQEASLADVNAELAAKQKDFSAREEDYAATVMNLLRMQSLPPTALFTAPENMRQIMRTATVLEQTNSALALKATQLRDEMAQLKQLQAVAKERSAQTRSEQAALKTEQTAMAQAIAERQKLANKLSADQASAQAKVASLSHASQSLQDLIHKLDENSRMQAARRTRAAEPEPRMRTFEGRKDGLKAPVAGTIIHHFGERKNDNESWRGLVYRARAGATVVAPYDGEIVFTGPFRDYGRMVLIKHKGGYITLIAGLGEISASLDQTVMRGEPIGTMPEAGSTDAYVEVRDKDAKPIDPSDWFAKVP